VSDEERFAAELRDVDLFGSLAALKGPRYIHRVRSLGRPFPGRQVSRGHDRS